jgi:VWFA-related protein
MLDMLNTPYLSQAQARRGLVEYLQKSLRRDEPMALYGLRGSGLKQLHPFTQETATLIEALKKVRGEVGAAEMGEQSAAVVADAAAMLGSQSARQEAQEIGGFLNDLETTTNAAQSRQSIRTTLEAMTQLGHAYAAIPGRKTLIWASGGFPFMIDDPQAFARMGTDMFERYEEAWRALVSAQIAVYTVDVTGLSGGGSNTVSGDNDARRRRAGSSPGRSMSGLSPALNLPYDKGAQQAATLRAFAEATGGLPCTNTNDLEKCFARAVDDSRQYYLLGYYLPADDAKPGWRKLKVKVQAAGVHVRAREGFYVPGPADDSAEARRKALVEAMQSPVEYTGVRMNVREVAQEESSKPAAARKQQHEFNVAIIGSSIAVDSQQGNAADLQVLAVAFDSQGRNAGHNEHHFSARLKPELLEKLRQSALGVRLALELPPGKYELHFAVMDNLSGEVGTLIYPLEVK